MELIFIGIVVIAFFLLVARFTKSPLRFGIITAVAGGLLALIALIIGSQSEPGLSTPRFLAFTLLGLGFYVLLGGLAVVVLHYVVAWIKFVKSQP